MNGRVTLLSGLLALQLVVIAVVLLVDSGVGDADAGPLLAFDTQRVDELRITADGDGALVLSRDGDGWRLPAGHPADGDKVRDVLERLAGLRAGWPVATTPGASERFEVSPESHQRHLVLAGEGETLAELYLGTSPGYQRVHARRADAEEIYAVALANYQVPAEADDWLDKTLLQPSGEVSAIEREGAWRLTDSEEGWLLDGEAADQDGARELARRLAELRVTGVAEAPAEGTEPVAVFRITDADGDYRLRVYADEDGGDHRLASDRRDGYFGYAGYLADSLLVDRDALVPQEAGDPAGAGDDPAGSGDDAAGAADDAAGTVVNAEPAAGGRAG
jgi:hypothetical protein